ncbi:MAG: hypothetical protein WCL16_11220 [bacterium]
MKCGRFQRACTMHLTAWLCCFTAQALLMVVSVVAAPLTNNVEVRVVGADFGGRNTVAAWCHTELEPVLDRLQNNWPHGAPMLVVRLYGAANDAPRIERFPSTCVNRGGTGTVAVTGWVNLNGEALLEACAGVALDAGLGCSVPDWFAAGLVQGGQPGCRARNRLLCRAEPPSATPSLEMLLAWIRLPGDMPLQRAWCGEMVLFITGHGNPATRALLQRLAGGAPVTTMDLALELQVTAVELERQWKGWVAGREQVFQEMGGLTPDAVDGLREHLSARISEGSPLMPPRDFLQPGADTPAVRRAADRQAYVLRRFQAGQDPELAAVAGAYAFYYEGVARARWRWRLRHRLEKAERALADLERVTIERTRWLDEIARETEPEVTPPDLVVEKSRLREYIDRIERETTASETTAPFVR